MSAHEHTPGPWVVADAHGPIDGATCVQSIHDSNLVASCTHYYPREQVQANARLIASAPMLLQALQSLVNESVHPYDGADYEDGEWLALDAARSAIAIATGEQT